MTWGRGSYKDGQGSAVESILAEMAEKARLREERERQEAMQRQRMEHEARLSSQDAKTRYLQELIRANPKHAHEIMRANSDAFSGVAYDPSQFQQTPEEQFSGMVVKDAIATFPTLPQHARQAGVYQLGYGAAMPSESVQASIAQDVYGNPQQFAPQMQERQSIGDKRSMSAKEAEDARLDALRTAAQTASGYAQARLYDAQRKTEGAKPSAPSDPSADYAAEKADRVVAGVEKLRPRVSFSTVGPLALPLSKVPGTDAYNLAADIESLKANIAFNELAQMRAASKTGGALGNVSDKESALLSSVLGSLNQGQSPAHFQKALDQIEASQKRWRDAKAKFAAPTSAGSGKTVTRAELRRMGASEEEATANGYKVVD